ncbi:cytochrome P450 [Paenibacillus sp. 7523-1]|uniref:cytochrome P450 n=1 Tax=Paenibacillus sp. 7523-1 TaxID=2022550 RepID=UPI000BA7AD41|nr:cytochrome P450 [Paenibacillus sp. 7523-1]PAD28706.1 cytochrome P450 [Paenibacillus sp. 7523-1]
MNVEVVSAAAIPNFKTKSEEFFPIQWYRNMLEENPVFYHEETNSWNVFGYNHVKKVLSDHKLFSSGGNRTIVQVGANNKEGSVPKKLRFLDMDPPQHQKYRSLVSAAFTPRSLTSWEPRIQQVITELVNKIEDKATNHSMIDIVESYAGPLPSMVMADIMGVPVEDSHLFKNWVDILFQPFNKENEEEVQIQKQNAAKEYYQHIYPIVERKRLNPGDDIISDLISAEVENEKFTDDEVVRTTMQLLGAGIETTSHLISSAFYSMLYEDTSIYQQLKQDPELVDNMVEEMLRYRFHISKRHRNVKEDNDVLGVKMKKGDLVIAWMSAANVDGEVFENSYKLDITRKNNKKNLTFGIGPHFCLGAPLARMEAKIAFSTFIERFSEIRQEPSFTLEENLAPSAPGQSLIRLPLHVIR